GRAAPSAGPVAGLVGVLVGHVGQVVAVPAGVVLRGRTTALLVQQGEGLAGGFDGHQGAPRSRACLVDLGRRERPSGGMDRKAEEELIAELLATTTTPRGALRRLCSQTLCSRLKICETRPGALVIARIPLILRNQPSARASRRRRARSPGCACPPSTQTRRSARSPHRARP